MTATWRVLEGDCRGVLASLDAGSVQTCVTSPPYFGLRDYGLPHSEWADGWVGCLGREPAPEMYVAHMVEVFAAVRRTLADDGTAWINLGDSYGPGKQLQGIPWMVAFALRADGWCLRSDTIWAKPNPMPESVTDRPTKSHEYVFLLSKGPRYFYDADAIREPHATAARNGDRRSYKPGSASSMNDGEHQAMIGSFAGLPLNEAGRNKRSVWTVAAAPYPGAHFATFPPKLIEPCILAGCPEDATVLDPFAGTGTTGMVALRHDRSFIGIELSSEYVRLARDRIIADSPLLNTFAEAVA